MSELRDDDVLDGKLAGFYAAERRDPLPAGSSARVLAAALAATAATGAGAGGAAAAAATGGGAAGVTTKAVVGIAVASALGGATVGVVGYRAIATAPAPVPTPVVSPAPPVVPAPMPTAPDAAVVVPPLDAATAPLDAPRGKRAAAPSDAAAPSPADDREALLVDQARTAIRRGLADEALVALMRHARLHPDGTLAEERDVLLIEAYLAQGDDERARDRLERYRRDRPNGFLRARVDRLAEQLR